MGTAVHDSTCALNSLLQTLSRAPEIGSGMEQGLVLYPPHRFEGGRVAGQPGNHMPVDVGKLIAEEFIIDFPGVINLSDNLGHQVHFFHQLNAFCWSQMKQLCCMALEHDDGPPGKELIVVQIGLGEAEVGNKMVGTRPGSCADLTGRVCHG